MAWTVVRDALLLLAAAPLIYYVIAIFAAARFFRAQPAGSSIAVSAFTPPISILKPIHGLDRETYENYASFCNQDYPEFEILFCVGDGRDPAVSIIEILIADFPSGRFACLSARSRRVLATRLTNSAAWCMKRAMRH